MRDSREVKYHGVSEDKGTVEITEEAQDDAAEDALNIVSREERRVEWRVGRWCGFV